MKINYLIEGNSGWIRITVFKHSRAIVWKDVDKHGMLFSERYGYKKHIKIGKWLIKFVK